MSAFEAVSISPINSLQTCQKITSCFYGPYQILEKIGPMAYKLVLQKEARIHPMFHISLLKQYQVN